MYHLTLQPYNITVKYKPGKELLLADALSRAYMDTDNFSILEDEIQAQVHDYSKLTYK